MTILYRTKGHCGVEAKGPPRRGVSVVELAVALSILSLFLAVAIPAAVKARAESREAKCSDNLRAQIQGVQNYELTFGYYPSNGWGFRWVGEPGGKHGADQPGSWAYSVLPHMQQQSAGLVNAYALSGSGLPNNQDLLSTPLPVLRCPTRGTDVMVLNDPNTRPFNARWVRRVFRMDYASNEGDVHFKTDSGPLSLEQAISYKWPDNTTATGIMYQRSEVTRNQVIDGLTNTYFLGEKYVYFEHYLTTISPGYDQCAFAGADLDTNRCTAQPPAWDKTDLRHFRNEGAEFFGSAHPDFCWFAFGDGSVQRVAYSINPEVHRKRGNRADGLSPAELAMQSIY